MKLKAIVGHKLGIPRVHCSLIFVH